MEGQAIEQCGSQSLVTARLGPLGKGNGGGHDQTDMLMQGGQTTEEEVRFCFGKRHKPDFIEDDEVEPEQAAFKSGQPVCCLCFQQLVGEAGCREEVHASALLTGRHR
jgi:hypothetical protein